MSRQFVSRWQFAVSVTLTLVAAGIVFTEPVLLVGGLVPLAFVGYDHLGRTPTSELTFERQVDTEAPAPGAELDVTLTVRNESDSVAPDVRIADGVPGPLPVVDGSPRAAVTLLPDESTSVEYTLRARRGVFRFDDVQCRTRNVPGGRIRTFEATASGTDVLRGLQVLDTFPLPQRNRQYVGSSPANTGGEGVEFFGSREYQPSDPASRIDWNRLASTGELTTLVHREERARTIVFVLDVTAGARVGGGEGTYTGVELGSYAVERGAYALLSENDSVGLALYGASDDDRPTFVPPGGGDATLERIRHVLSDIGPFSPDALVDSDEEPPASDVDATADASQAEPSTATDGGRSFTADELLAQTPRDTQYVFVSPLLDDESLTVVETVTDRDRTATVLSPDVIRGESVGARVERVNRHRRVSELRSTGVPVVDWDADEPLAKALVRGAVDGGLGADRRWDDA